MSSIRKLGKKNRGKKQETEKKCWQKRETERQKRKRAERERERETERERKNVIRPRGDHDSVHMPYGTAQFRRSLSASGTAWQWAYTLLAWDQFIGSDYVGRVPTERKLARVPAPRVESQKACCKRMSQSITDHRSQKESPTRARLRP